MDQPTRVKTGENFVSKRKKNDLTFIWRWTRITRRETKGVLASIRKLKEVQVKFNSGHMLYSNYYCNPEYQMQRNGGNF